MIIQRTPLIGGLPVDVQASAVHGRTDNIPDFAADVTRMAAAAALEFEAYAQIALLDQTITVTLEVKPSLSLLPLPVAPLLDPMLVGVTVDGVAYDDFAVISGMRPALRFSTDRPCGVYVVEYMAGFGETSADVPQDIQNAIFDQAAVLFDMRGGGDGKTNGMSPHMARVAARYRRVAV